MKATLPLLLLLAMIASYGCKQEPAGSLAPQSLTIEYLHNPIGVATATPRLSWQLSDSRRGAAQTGFQVVVARTEDLLTPEKADVWNSDRQESDQSHLVDYAGKPLEGGLTYWWKVRTWDQDGKPSPWSEAASFEVAIAAEILQKVPWVGIDVPKAATTNRLGDTLRVPRSVMLRGEFSCKEKPLRARAYVSGAGGYALSINGQKVSGDVFSPGWTDYHQRIHFQTYDVTSLLKMGKNAAGALLGNLWWSSGLGWDGSKVYSEGPLRFMAMIVVEYAQGKTDTFRTGPSWTGALSPIVENTLYHGEVYDARLEQAGWDKAGFDAKSWTPVATLEAPSPAITPALAPPVLETEVLAVVSIKEMGKDTFIADLGQNFSGVVRLKVKGSAGTRVQLRFGEIVQPDGRLYTENLRTARATDAYILKGAGEEVWAPNFTYHGFRYVEITGYPGTPTKEAVSGIVLNSNLPQTGVFASDNKILNQLEHNIGWGFRSNFMSIPTDCPQRDERLGWMGDIQAVGPTACYQWEMLPFMNQYLQAIRDGQDKSGYVYDVNPAIVVDGPAKPGWGDAIAILPWTLYRFYGDKQVLADNYTAIKSWVEYMSSQSKGDLYYWKNKENNWFGYGDWIATEPSPGKPIGAAYYFRSAQILAKMAELLGRTDDARKYDSLTVRIAQAFNAAYFDKTTSQYEGKTQTANLLPVAFGISPPDDAPAVMRNVVKNVLDHEVHLTTGFLGTGMLLPMLSDFGEHDLAWQLSQQTTAPSWGYMVDQGATTFWELWDSDKKGPAMNSRNHYAMAAIGEWMYGYLAGIQPDGNHPGFKQFLVAPRPVGKLRSARAKLTTPYGQLAVQWEVLGKEFSLHVLVPPNTKATVLIPLLKKTTPSLLESEEFIYKDEGPLPEHPHIRFLGRDEDVIALEVDAGDYHFQLF